MPDHTQLRLPTFDQVATSRASDLSDSNAVQGQDRAFHEWYRFVLSYPPHLVRRYARSFGLVGGDTLLDPFCGTGTTVVEAKLNGLRGVGIEAHPLSQFAAETKVSWDVDADRLLADAQTIAQNTLADLERAGVQDDLLSTADPADLGLSGLPKEQHKLLIKNSLSPMPLAKSLPLRAQIDRYASAAHYAHLRLAFAKALVDEISNLRFGPEVGVGKIKVDTPVVAPWLAAVRVMANDLSLIGGHAWPTTHVHLGDARSAGDILPRQSVQAVITSPPYPNEKDYSRTTRLESVMLGFVSSKPQLRQVKKGLVRSNTRGVYKADTDDTWIESMPDIVALAEAIEARRIELGKTSGFERLYHRVTRLYFGGMARHLSSLRTALAPGARLAYVVGDQASYLRVMIRTGTILSQIAESLGYQVDRIDLFRKRFATATQQELREEVVVLTWPGER